MVLAALRELRPQVDGLLIDAEFFVQFAERRRCIVLPYISTAPRGVAQKPWLSS